MTGKVHCFGGACAGGITVMSAYMYGADKYEIGGLLLAFAGAFLGSRGALLPDIDTPYSMISKEHPILSSFIYKRFEHRTGTHSLVVPLALSVFAAGVYGLNIAWSYFAFLLILGFLSGYVFHLVQDACTMAGVPWAYPIVKRNFSMRNVSGGTWRDCLVTVVLLFVQYVFLQHLFWFI